MIKLLNAISLIKEKVAQDTFKNLTTLKSKLSGPLQNNSLQANQQKKHSKLFIESRIKSKQSIRSYRPLAQIQIDRKAQDLIKRKRRLLQQLKSIDDELQKVNQIKTNKKKKEHAQPEEVLYSKATDLVSKMNKQRKQITQKRKKQANHMDKTVQQSINKYKEILQNEQKQKQRRRKQIQKRIQQRKNAVLTRSKMNRQSNSLINQLKSYNTSLPQISRFILDPQKSQNLDHKQVKTGKRKTSPFLQKLKKEEELAKRQNYLKGLQKKRVRMKHEEYSMKFRSRAKHIADSQTFVT